MFTRKEKNVCRSCQNSKQIAIRRRKSVLKMEFARKKIEERIGEIYDTVGGV